MPNIPQMVGDAKAKWFVAGTVKRRWFVAAVAFAAGFIVRSFL